MNLQGARNPQPGPSAKRELTPAEAEVEAVKKHITLFSIDTVECFNERAFDRARAMGHAVSKEFTAQILDAGDSMVSGWEEFISHYERLLAEAPTWHAEIQDVSASVDLANGTAESYGTIEQTGQPVGVRTTVVGVSYWRRPGKKWYLWKRTIVKGVGPDYVR